MGDSDKYMRYIRRSGLPKTWPRDTHRSAIRKRSLEEAKQH